MDPLCTIAKMTTIGYCGNVHPISSLSELVDTINGPTFDIAQQTQEIQPLALGLWLPKVALTEALKHSKALREACDQKPFKIGGFTNVRVVRQAVALVGDIASHFPGEEVVKRRACAPHIEQQIWMLLQGDQESKE